MNNAVCVVLRFFYFNRNHSDTCKWRRLVCYWIFGIYIFFLSFFVQLKIKTATIRTNERMNEWKTTTLATYIRHYTITIIFYSVERLSGVFLSCFSFQLLLLKSYSRDFRCWILFFPKSIYVWNSDRK